MGGRLRLERRNKCKTIYMRTFAQGKDRVKSTRETSLVKAIAIAEDWWDDLRHQVRGGVQLDAPTFASAAAGFLENALQEHSPSQVRNFTDKWSVLKPFFGETKVVSVDKPFLLDLRAKRSTCKNLNGEPLKPATLKKDMLFVRLVLRHAKDQMKCIDHLPDFPAFTRNSKWEIVAKGRPRFTRREYFRLLKTAIRRAREPGLVLLTVRCEIARRSPISRSVRPSATSVAISNCRGDTEKSGDAVEMFCFAMSVLTECFCWKSVSSRTHHRVETLARLLQFFRALMFFPPTCAIIPESVAE